MTLSKYCRIGGINILGVSKDTGIPMKELNRIYHFNILLFTCIINSKGLLKFSDVAAMFQVTVKKIQVWRMRGLKAVRDNGRNYLYYPVVCNFIASGRA